MIGLAFMFAAGINFAEQPLPGLDVSTRTFPAAIATTNTRVSDIDEDGLADIVLPTRVWIQKSDLFPKASSIPLPNRRQFDIIHAETGRLYGCTKGEIVCFSLYGQRWRNEWTAQVFASSATFPAQPLFHDLDGDGHIELIAPADGLFAVQRVSESAQLMAELRVFPPIRPQLKSVNNLWAASTTPSLSAIATNDFHVTFDGSALTTREVLRTNEHRVQHNFATYTFQQNSDGTYSATPTDKWTSPILPDVMVPYRSLREGKIAFAGARAFRIGTTRLGETPTEVLFAARDSETIQTIRTKAPLPFLALADFDGDGDEDLLTQSNTMLSGPPREVLTRLMSAHSVRHSFSVHVQNTDGQFESRARQTLAVDIELGSSAFENNARWQAYRQGTLSCASADFNGDRRADIAVWMAANQIGVWLNHEGIFQKSPDTILQVSSGIGLSAADVDRDGRADLVVLPRPSSGDPATVWFSR